MILLEPWKLAFVHVPRTGGCSVAASLWPLLRGGTAPIDAFAPGWPNALHVDAMHGYAYELPDDWTIVGVKRNPWTRILSFYQSRPHGDEMAMAGFGKWMRWFVDTGGATRMSPGGNPDNIREQVVPLGRCNRVLRFEALAEEWDDLCAEHGLAVLPLPHRNRGPEHDRFILTDREAAAVAELWPRDCGTLGYHPPGR